MAGLGTGVPITFRCPVARRNQFVDDRYHGGPGFRTYLRYPKGHDEIVRTGRVRKSRNPRGNAIRRNLLTEHEYVCECGHVGWSRHSGVLDHPLRQEGI